MIDYNIGDKIKCKQAHPILRSTYLEGTNPVVLIPVGFIMEIIDKEVVIPDESVWYHIVGDVTDELKDLNPQAQFLSNSFGLDAWNDEDTCHIDKYFDKVEC